MFPNWQLVVLSIGYICLLFLIAFLGDRYRHKLAAKQHIAIYALSLGVYCTSWGFLGTSAQASNFSFSFLSVYIAPILLFVFAWPFIQRIIRVSLALNITSIADLLAARFGKSQRLAILITFVALIGTIPYISLQLKAIVHSYIILQEDQDLPLWQLGLLVSAILAGFTIIFGIRTIDVTERHPGVMIAIAFESIVKLVAFLTIGLFVSFYLFDSPMDIWQQSTESLDLSQQFELSNLVSIFGMLVIVMSAFLCLPRQFQVMVVELKEQQHTSMSRWMFPLYVLVFAFFAIPLGLAGNILYGDTLQSDAYVLFLPSYHGHLWLTLLSFLGAISAASSMVIISTIALSTMLSNEIVFPILFKHSNMHNTDFHRFQKLLLLVRKLLVVFVILLSCSMFLLAPPDRLSSLGEVAFGAIAQIGPPLFAAFYWRRINLSAVLAGITTGFTLWLVLNLFPQIGLYQHPLANSGLPATTVATLIGLAANSFVLWFISLIKRPSIQEQMQIEHFFERPNLQQLPLPKFKKIDTKELELLVTRFVGKEKASAIFQNFYQKFDQEKMNRQAYNEALINHTENSLASVMGSASARLVISFAIDGRDIAIDEVAQLVEDASSQRVEFSHSVLQSAIENTSEGISVIDSDLKMVAWNQKYLSIFKYPKDLVFIGCHIRDLIRFNLLHRPEFKNSINAQVEKRLKYMRAGSRHSSERTLPDGRIIKIEGNPIPAGGFVMIFTDITMFRQAENLLKEKNLDLESRVIERTKKLELAKETLEKTNTELAIARSKAEQAHFKKSQYLKACSHDLIQPLSAAKLFSSTLAMSKKLGKKELEQIEYIDNSLSTANNLLLDLNEIARIESGNIKVERTNIALADVFSSLAKEFAPLADNNQIDFRCFETKYWLNTDKKLLRRILQNLLSNAFRYASPGAILLGCRRQNNSVIVQVLDNGPGIPLTMQNTVFEQFTQLTHQHKSQSTGLGLGLNISQGLADILGSKISLLSQPNQGCNFSIELPFATPKVIANASNIGAVKAQNVITLEGIYVLVIDNEPNVLKGMKNLLSSWGCKVLIAENATLAINLFNRYQDQINIVLADYQLDNNEDGLTLLAELEKIKRYPIPGILITATTDETVQEQAKKSGYGYIKKMVKPIALRALMSAILSKALQNNYLSVSENDDFSV